MVGFMASLIGASGFIAVSMILPSLELASSGGRGNDVLVLWKRELSSAWERTGLAARFIAPW